MLGLLAPRVLKYIFINKNVLTEMFSRRPNHEIVVSSVAFIVKHRCSESLLYKSVMTEMFSRRPNHEKILYTLASTLARG